MEELERYGEKHIIDNNKSIVVNIENSRIYYFNFNEMTVREGDKKTLKPIRYITESKTIRVWGNSKWLRFSNQETCQAIAKLFDNHNERILLGIGVKHERKSEEAPF